MFLGFRNELAKVEEEKILVYFLGTDSNEGVVIFWIKYLVVVKNVPLDRLELSSERIL